MRAAGCPCLAPVCQLHDRATSSVTCLWLWNNARRMFPKQAIDMGCHSTYIEYIETAYRTELAMTLVAILLPAAVALVIAYIAYDLVF